MCGMGFCGGRNGEVKELRRRNAYFRSVYPEECNWSP